MDKIEKQVTLRAPVGRVWKALTDASEFSKWFRVQLDGAFVPGKSVTGTFDVNPEKVVEYQKSRGLTPSKVRLPPKGTTFCTVEKMGPERYFSFRWIPYGVDGEADLANEPTTLVEFRLEPAADGTLLTIVESGFDQVPAHRRERAFRMNEGGWNGQAENLKAHVEK